MLAGSASGALIHVSLAQSALPLGRASTHKPPLLVITSAPVLAGRGNALVDIRGAGGTEVASGARAVVGSGIVVAGGSIQTASIGSEALVDINCAGGASPGSGAGTGERTIGIRAGTSIGAGSSSGTLIDIGLTVSPRVVRGAGTAVAPS